MTTKADNMPIEATSKLNAGLSSDDMNAAYMFVDTMVHRADMVYNGGYLWHGWALREAFIAGAKWQRDKRAYEGSKPK